MRVSWFPRERPRAYLGKRGFFINRPKEIEVLHDFARTKHFEEIGNDSNCFIVIAYASKLNTLVSRVSLFCFHVAFLIYKFGYFINTPSPQPFSGKPMTHAIVLRPSYSTKVADERLSFEMLLFSLVPMLIVKIVTLSCLNSFVRVACHVLYK